MIPNLTLFVVVVVQVIAFQFLARRLTRLFPDAIVSSAGASPAVAEKIDLFRRQAGRGRRALGILYLLAAGALLLLLVQETRQQKLGLAAISVASSLTLVAGVLSDRKRFLRIAADLPESGVRAASLQRRRLWDSYPPVLEAAPIAIFLLTVGGTILFAAGGAGSPLGILADFRLWRIPLIQLVLLGGLFAMSMSRGSAPGCLPLYTKALGYRPEEMVRLHERLRHHEARYDLAIRIGIALQFAAMQAKGLVRWSGDAVPPALAGLSWLITLALLAVFAGYLLTLRRAVRVQGTSERIAADADRKEGGSR